MAKDPKEQSLITKDDEQEWLGVLHGEIEISKDNDTHIDAATIRSYLVARDEAIAVNTIVDEAALGTISSEEARIIYHRTQDRIRREREGHWFRFLKTYGLAAVIGGLIASGATLFSLNYFEKKQTVTTQVQDEGINYADYPALGFDDLPGLFPNMLLIPGGVSNIGCAKGWDDAMGGCRPTEFPSHAVRVETFEISQHEVTYGQFRQFVQSTDYVTDAEKEGRGCVHEDMSSPGQPFVMNPELHWSNPGYEQTDSFPVACVSWHDAQNYILWLNTETQSTYRLPTEAEWEHAARGGQSTAYYWGSAASKNQANYKGVGGKDQWPFAAPVGQFPANKYAVQDTSGNLWEWVQDCWHPSYEGAPADGSEWVQNCKDPTVKVRRGGAWDMNAAGVRSAIRSPGSQHDRSNLYGFRVARDWQKPK